MRIIGGDAGGRLLRTPEGLGVRPMPDKVKLAVFNSLGDRVVDARVLDLFAGTGALGLECLSRGARQLTSYERSEKHARFYRANLASAALPGIEVSLRVQDVFVGVPQLAREGRQFELIIADPPYGEKTRPGKRSESLAQQLLDVPELPGMLAPGGRFVLGHTKRDQVTIPAHWVAVKELKHGDTIIRFLERPESPPAAPAATADSAPAPEVPVTS